MTGVPNMLFEFCYAKIIPQKKKNTWSNINSIAYDQWKEVGGLSNFDSWYVNWLEDNYAPPIALKTAK